MLKITLKASISPDRRQILLKPAYFSRLCEKRNHVKWLKIKNWQNQITHSFTLIFQSKHPIFASQQQEEDDSIFLYTY